MMLIVGLGTFAALGVALLIVDYRRELRFLTFFLLFSVLIFALFTYIALIAPVREPLLPLLAVIAASSLFGGFCLTGVYWVQRHYLNAARRAEEAPEPKRKPGQYY